MSYQSDTLVDVLKRGLARSEALDSTELAYLGEHVTLFLKTVSSYSEETPQYLTHDDEGTLEWLAIP